LRPSTRNGNEGRHSNGLHPTGAPANVRNERAVHALLKEHISTPGAYIANPPLSLRGEFPPGEPVFGIRHSGVGHEAAGRSLLIDLAIALVASLLVAGLLSAASPRILSRYPYRVMYVATIGLLLARANEGSDSELVPMTDGAWFSRVLDAGGGDHLHPSGRPVHDEPAVARSRPIDQAPPPRRG